MHAPYPPLIDLNRYSSTDATQSLETLINKHFKYTYKHNGQETVITMLGNQSIWKLPKTAFLSSDRYSAGSVLKSFDWATLMKKRNRCIISGFHSQLEASVLEILLKTGSSPIIWVLARGMFTRPSSRVRSYLATGQMLIVSQFDASIIERSRERAAERNQFVIENADEVVYAHIRENGMLSHLKIPDGVPLRVLDRES